MPLEDQGKESKLITITGHGTVQSQTGIKICLYIYTTVLKLSVIRPKGGMDGQQFLFCQCNMMERISPMFDLMFSILCGRGIGDFGLN